MRTRLSICQHKQKHTRKSTAHMRSSSQSQTAAHKDTDAHAPHACKRCKKQAHACGLKHAQAEACRHAAHSQTALRKNPHMRTRTHPCDALAATACAHVRRYANTKRQTRANNTQLHMRASSHTQAAAHRDTDAHAHAQAHTYTHTRKCFDAACACKQAYAITYRQLNANNTQLRMCASSHSQATSHNDRHRRACASAHMQVLETASVFVQSCASTI
jgi:hypothetical protein